MTMKNTAVKPQKSMALKDAASDKVFFVINALFLGLMALIVLYPIYFIVIASFSDPDAVLGGQVVLWPVQLNFEGYQKVMQRADIWTGYGNTILYTLATVVLSLLVTIPGGWALSRKTTPGKKFWMLFFIIPMFFGGGLIPFYNVMSSLHLINSPWAIILPSVLSVWNLFMCKTFFESSIPEGMLEAAKIDGSGTFRTFFSIVLPLSKAVIAVITLYYAVGHWNAYFNAMLYLSNRDLYPLQLILRDILVSSKVDLTEITDPELLAAMMGLENLLKYAVIVVSSLPIIAVYPFVQKYFIKGVMIGSVKG